MKTKYLGNLKTREQWLEKALSEVASGSRILDAGAGELQYKRFCQHLNYVAQDFGEYNGEGNTNGLQTGTWDNSKLDIISDITKIPEDDASFDAIMCIEVLNTFLSR
jgi:ubiquinone/menaquinone biosynthesis C-methylase UbiE